MGLVLMQLLTVVPQEFAWLPDPFGWTPLHILANNKDEFRQKPGMILQLLDKQADIEARKGKNKQTVLMTAAATAHYEAVETLLLNGADINARNKEGTSTWDMAWHNGELRKLLERVTKQLAGRGATGSGRTQCYFTVSCGDKPAPKPCRTKNNRIVKSICSVPNPCYCSEAPNIARLTIVIVLGLPIVPWPSTISFLALLVVPRLRPRRQAGDPPNATPARQARGQRWREIRSRASSSSRPT